MMLKGITMSNISRGVPPPCGTRIVIASSKRPCNLNPNKTYANRGQTSELGNMPEHGHTSEEWNNAQTPSNPKETISIFCVIPH